MFPSGEDVGLWGSGEEEKHLDGLVGVGDEGDEEAEHHVDEEGDEGVEVDSAEQPHQVRLVPHGFEGGVHVVAVDEREETLRHLVQGSELEGDACILFPLFDRVMFDSMTFLWNGVS